MRKISRRTFLKQSLAGGTAFSISAGRLFGYDLSSQKTAKIGQVVLGKSGVKVSRLAFGTGTRGWKFKSDQTDLGDKGFIDLALHAIDSGITFIDMADIYGSHGNIKQLLQHIPREKLVIMSKIWTQANDWLTPQSPSETFDRFRKEAGTDYFDIILVHCQTSPDWINEQKELRDFLSQAKEKGMIRAHGVSCHSLDALKTAATSDWVDIVLTRINNVGNRMDDAPEKVMPVIKSAHDNGKGIIGMKIFGCGELVSDEQRESSLQYVWKSNNVDAMTIGYINKTQIDDTIARVNRILG